MRPIFVGGTLEGWATTVAHQNDIGGIVPGSNSIGSTEIFQEGLRLPPVKFYERGQMNDILERVIRLNVRVPERVLGDLKAQYAASRGLLLRRLPELGFDPIFPVDGAFYAYASTAGLAADSSAFAARMLAEAGVHRIEAGMPAVSPMDAQAIKMIVKKNLPAEIFAFSRCMKCPRPGMTSR